MTEINNSKPILVYFNPDCYVDTDLTILKHLTSDYKVIWFYLYESLKAGSMGYNPSLAKEYAVKHGIVLEVFDPRMRRRNPLNIVFYREIAKKINAYHPDIVYACNLFPFWAYCKPLIQCNTKVLGLHDVISHSYSFSISRTVMLKCNNLLMKSFENILTFSKNQHDVLLNRYGKESYLVGMSCKNLGTTQKIPCPIKDGIDLLFFGSIHLYKGLDILINTIEVVISEGINNLRLTIAGNGKLWEQYSKLIKTPEYYNLNIRFIDNNEIPDLMGAHHFLVLPYRDATQSGPLAIAIGYNLPIIAPNFGCFEENYDNSSAILYEKGELKKALCKAAHISQQEYDDMKASTEKIREKCSEIKIAEKYKEAFSLIISDNKKLYTR